MKNKTVLFAFTILTLHLFSCSAKTSNELSPVPPAEANDSKVGPFAVDFNSVSLTYDHTLRIPIDQSGGKIEYFVLTDQVEKIVLDNASSSTMGCEASQVQHQIYWIPDVTTTAGQILTNKSQFTTLRKVKGKVVHTFLNLAGCTEIEVKMTLRKLPSTSHVGLPCTGASTATECRVDVYCREKYPTSFVEVEVWNRNGIITLQKYFNSGTSPRSMMSLNSARLSSSATSIVYTSTTANRTNLVVDSATQAGAFTETVGGTDYTNRLNCEL